MAHCERNKECAKGETDATKIWLGSDGEQAPSYSQSTRLITSTSLVLSSQIDFDPKGTQFELFKDDPPRPAVGGILLAKMRGGQVSFYQFLPMSSLQSLIILNHFVLRKSSLNYIVTKG
jgi:hypothetical protein